MAKLTDRDIVEKARNGDVEAFGQLVRRHQQRIHRVVLHLLKDTAEAEDVTQEAFIRAYRALDRFDGRSEPFTWLYRIAINLALNSLRSRRTSPARDTRLDGVPDGMGEGGPGERRDPGTLAANKQLYEALAEGIDGLSESLRVTLVLVCIDGRSHEEAAAILGAPEGTIAWRIHEARRKLREFLSGKGFLPEGEVP